MFTKLITGSVAAGLGLALAIAPAQAEPGNGKGYAYGKGCELKCAEETLTVGAMFQLLRDKDGTHGPYGNPKSVVETAGHDDIRTVHDWIELRCNAPDDPHHHDH